MPTEAIPEAAQFNSTGPPSGLKLDGTLSAVPQHVHHSRNISKVTVRLRKENLSPNLLCQDSLWPSSDLKSSNYR